MAQCKDCKFYKPIDDTKGDCFGHEVPATLDSDKCPTNSFQPRNQSDQTCQQKQTLKKA